MVMFNSLIYFWKEVEHDGGKSADRCHGGLSAWRSTTSKSEPLIAVFLYLLFRVFQKMHSVIGYFHSLMINYLRATLFNAKP